MKSKLAALIFLFALFAFFESAQSKGPPFITPTPSPTPTPAPTPTPTPTPTGATTWYVPGVKQNLGQFGCDYIGSLWIVNPGAIAGTVTVIFVDQFDQTIVDTQTVAIPAHGQVLVTSCDAAATRSSFDGYAKVTSDVPVLLNARQDLGNIVYHLDAYPASP